MMNNTNLESQFSEILFLKEEFHSSRQLDLYYKTLYSIMLWIHW